VAARSAALRRAVHQGLHAVSQDIEALRFNRAIARVHELANTLSDAMQQPASARADGAVLREGARILVQAFAPMMPHLAESCWQALGGQGLVAQLPWPEANPALLVESTVTIAVQVNGKRRDEVAILKGLPSSEVEQIVLKLDNVRKALEGRPVKKIIVVPDRIANVVVG
jgi:leucyl-tRNA synthetase